MSSACMNLTASHCSHFQILICHPGFHAMINNVNKTLSRSSENDVFSNTPLISGKFIGHSPAKTMAME